MREDNVKSTFNIFQDYLLSRNVYSIGKIKKITLRIPNEIYFISHYEVLINTIYGFLIHTYNYFEKIVKSSFNRSDNFYVDGIYELLELETEKLNLHNKLSNKYFLTVTKIENNKKTLACYYANIILVGRIIEKFKNTSFVKYGAFELLLKFLTYEFPDQAWLRYNDLLNYGVNITFIELENLNIEHTLQTEPINFAEGKLHGDDSNNILYVKILSVYKNLMLQLNASGNLREYFDKVTENVKVDVSNFFISNINSNL